MYSLQLLFRLTSKMCLNYAQPEPKGINTFKHNMCKSDIKFLLLKMANLLLIKDF